MSDNKVVKLQVLDRTAETPVKEEKSTKTYNTTNTSNPIYKNLLAFHHAKIGDKLTISDILR